MCGTSVCRRHIGCRCTDIWTHNHNDINAFANLAQCPACTDPTSTHAVRPTTCKLLREHFRFRLPSSGAGTNLKGWGGGIDPARRKKFLVGRVPPLFGSKSAISCCGERFRDGQYSLVSFLFAVLLLTVPPVPSHFVKVGDMCPRAPWSRRRCYPVN